MQREADGIIGHLKKCIIAHNNMVGNMKEEQHFHQAVLAKADIKDITIRTKEECQKMAG